MDRLQAMQTLVRVVEMGSFSAAARELGSTQSAVSKQVASLERQLGADLLVRSTRVLKLTDAGARYVDQARRLVAEVAEAESELREGEHRLQGMLRVACSVCFGRMKLMPLVQDFLARHPGLKVDLRLNDGFIDLIEQGIDVSVRIGELPDSSLVSRRIATMRRGIYASRSYVERHGAPSEPAEALDGLLDERAQLGLVAHVGADVGGAHAQALQLGGERLALGVAAAADDDAGAFVGEGEGGGTADAGEGAGDENDGCGHGGSGWKTGTGALSFSAARAGSRRPRLTFIPIGNDRGRNGQVAGHADAGARRGDGQLLGGGA